MQRDDVTPALVGIRDNMHLVVNVPEANCLAGMWMHLQRCGLEGLIPSGKQHPQAS